MVAYNRLELHVWNEVGKEVKVFLKGELSAMGNLSRCELRPPRKRERHKKQVLPCPKAHLIVKFISFYNPPVSLMQLPGLIRVAQPRSRLVKTSKKTLSA